MIALRKGEWGNAEAHECLSAKPVIVGSILWEYLLLNEDRKMFEKLVEWQEHSTEGHDLMKRYWGVDSGHRAKGCHQNSFPKGHAKQVSTKVISGLRHWQLVRGAKES